jgi:hypothetical protein
MQLIVFIAIYNLFNKLISNKYNKKNKEYILAFFLL